MGNAMLSYVPITKMFLVGRNALDPTRRRPAGSSVHSIYYAARREQNFPPDGLTRRPQRWIDDRPGREGMTQIDASSPFRASMSLSYYPSIMADPPPIFSQSTGRRYASYDRIIAGYSNGVIEITPIQEYLEIGHARFPKPSA